MNFTNILVILQIVQAQHHLTKEELRFVLRHFNLFLHHFTAKYSKKSKSFKGYRLIACDGSDINIAHNPDDKESYFTNGNTWDLTSCILMQCMIY